MYVTVALNRNTGMFALETDVDMDNVTHFLVEWIKSDIGHTVRTERLPTDTTLYVSICLKDDGKYEIEDNTLNDNVRRGLIGKFIADFKYLKNQINSKYVPEKK